MGIRKAGCFNHVHRAYDEPQETIGDIARALRMTEILENWEAKERRRVLELWEADNRATLAKGNKPKKADVTHTQK